MSMPFVRVVAQQCLIQADKASTVLRSLRVRPAAVTHDAQGLGCNVELPQSWAGTAVFVVTTTSGGCFWCN